MSSLLRTYTKNWEHASKPWKATFQRVLGLAMICPISVAYTGVRLRVTFFRWTWQCTPEVNPMHVPAMDANSRDKDTTAGRCALLDDAYTVTYVMHLLHCSTCNYLCCLLFMMHQWFDSNFSVYIYIYVKCMIICICIVLVPSNPPYTKHLYTAHSTSASTFPKRCLDILGIGYQQKQPWVCSLNLFDPSQKPVLLFKSIF